MRLLALLPVTLLAWVSPALANPLAGAGLYRSPDTSVQRYLDRNPDPLLARIAAQPQARWFDSASNRADIAGYVRSAGGSLPVLVAYDVPGRDCGSFSRGGAGSSAAYLRWIHTLVAAIGGHRAAVVLEPDALAELPCLPHGSLGLLRQATHLLQSKRNITAYVDAGHSAWIPAPAMASRLRAVGARHFALNVSNFNTTASEVAYGQRIARLLPRGSSWVIDTSRNGRGAAPGKPWCNPPGRGLGAPPTTSTGIPGVDALLWIKAPGESDGSCNGGPPAGGFWADYARQLALNGGS